MTDRTDLTYAFGVVFRPVHAPTRPRGHRDIRTRGVACGQRAGLRTRGQVRRGGHLLAVASQIRPDPVRMTAVVPTHRCGAVPEFHRVPSCDAPAWRTGRTSCTVQSRGPAPTRVPLFTSRNGNRDTGPVGRGMRGGVSEATRSDSSTVHLPARDPRADSGSRRAGPIHSVEPPGAWWSSPHHAPGDTEPSRLRPPDYLLTLNPWSVPYLMLDCCQASRPCDSVVEETYDLPTVSLNTEFAYTW